MCVFIRNILTYNACYYACQAEGERKTPLLFVCIFQFSNQEDSPKLYDSACEFNSNLYV